MTDEALTTEQLRERIGVILHLNTSQPKFVRDEITSEILALIASAQGKDGGGRENLLNGIAEVYQVVGTLSDMAGVFHDPQTIKVLDWLADPKGELDVLPYGPIANPPPSKMERTPGTIEVCRRCDGVVENIHTGKCLFIDCPLMKKDE